MTGQMMAVQIPAGMTAGQQMIIQAPNGMKMQIVVPPGVSPGQTIHVQVPEAAPAATKLSAAQMVLSRKALDIVMKKLAAEMIFSITRPQAEEAINELLQSESKELTAAGVGAFANRAFNVLKAKQAKLARGDPPAVRQPLQDQRSPSNASRNGHRFESHVNNNYTAPPTSSFTSRRPDLPPLGKERRGHGSASADDQSAALARESLPSCRHPYPIAP